VPYPSVDILRSVGSELSVSESETVYGLQNTESAFNRAEFAGLTQEEIDLLAEYAMFIKSRRNKD